MALSLHEVMPVDEIQPQCQHAVVEAVDDFLPAMKLLFAFGADFWSRH
jgi:hypothetical protein